MIQFGRADRAALECSRLWLGNLALASLDPLILAEDIGDGAADREIDPRQSEFNEMNSRGRKASRSALGAGNRCVIVYGPLRFVQRDLPVFLDTPWRDCLAFEIN